MLKASPDIQLIITDQAMPRMTGVAFAEEAKKSRPDLPIIIATGYAELPRGAGGFVKLDKPYFQSDLSDAISKAMTANTYP